MCCCQEHMWYGEGPLGQDEEPGSFKQEWTRRGSCAASALPQLSLRLAMLVRLSGDGEGKSEGEPVVIAVGVATSSMADEEE